MKNIILFTTLVIVVIATGCMTDSNTAQRPQPSQPLVTPVSPNSSPAAVSAPSATAPAAPALATASAGELNPAHGQPGHRCEIAVGAPLNSKPTQATTAPQPTATTLAAPAPVIAQPAIVPPPAAKGINPAHGQPGHRCDIAVGAPLDGKPAQPATTASPVIAPPTVTPKQATGTGINPAHGQPGHRCDIAVGAPLNSKPAQ